MFHCKSSDKRAMTSWLRVAVFPYLSLNMPGEGGGGGGEEFQTQAGSSVCCAETVGSRKIKLCDFYYILISFHF